MTSSTELIRQRQDLENELDQLHKERRESDFKRRALERQSRRLAFGERRNGDGPSIYRPPRERGVVRMRDEDDEEESSRSKRRHRDGDDADETDDKEETVEEKENIDKEPDQDKDKGSKDKEEKKDGDDNDSDNDNDKDKVSEEKDVEAVLEEKPKVKDEKIMKRHKRFFGGLLGHLNNAKTKLSRDRASTSMKKKEEMESRVAKKLSDAGSELHKKTAEEVEEMKEKLQTRQVEIVKELEDKRMKLLEVKLQQHRLQVANIEVIQTKTQPAIFYLPREHNDKTKALLRESMKLRKAAAEKVTDTIKERELDNEWINPLVERVAGIAKEGKDVEGGEKKDSSESMVDEKGEGEDKGDKTEDKNEKEKDEAEDAKLEDVKIRDEDDKDDGKSSVLDSMED